MVLIATHPDYESFAPGDGLPVIFATGTEVTNTQLTAIVAKAAQSDVPLLVPYTGPVIGELDMTTATRGWVKTYLDQHGSVGSGAAGKSAYQVAVEAGFLGTQSQWVASLQGSPGPQGPQGLSAYQIALKNGFVGSEAEWLDSLRGGTAGGGGSVIGVIDPNAPFAFIVYPDAPGATDPQNTIVYEVTEGPQGTIDPVHSYVYVATEE